MENRNPRNWPWVHDWDDANDRERYVFHAKETNAQARDREKHAQTAQLEYAKWILAALLAVHGGSIYVISNLRTKEFATKADPELLQAAIFNGAGIVFALLTAVFAWFNFGAGERLHSSYTNPAMVYRNDEWPKASKGDPINATYYLAVVSGAMSIFMFIASLNAVAQAISP